MSCDNNVVRITMPATTAFDDNEFPSTLRSIGERLGCPECFSGADCLLRWEKDFVVRNDQALPQDPVPIRTEFGGAVQVFMTQDVARDIGSLTKAAKIAFGKLGCLPCSTGFDVLLRSEIRALAIDENFKAQTFGKQSFRPI